jgi:hypothetical protein
MITLNAKLSAPTITSWATARLVIYLGSAAVTAVLFLASAALYSFVSPAPSQIVVPPTAVPSPPMTVPDKLLSPTNPLSVDPDETVKRIFSPNSVEGIPVSSLSWQLIGSATIITIKGGQFQAVGNPIAQQSFSSKDGFVLSVAAKQSGMHNDFGLRTPSEFLMRANDLRWYTVRYPTGIAFFAVATEEQVKAAMARAIK